MCASFRFKMVLNAKINISLCVRLDTNNNNKKKNIHRNLNLTFILPFHERAPGDRSVVDFFFFIFISKVACVGLDGGTGTRSILCFHRMIGDDIGCVHLLCIS